jgi:uncharacterized protein
MKRTRQTTRQSAPYLAPGESPFRLKVRRSPVHHWGVFALEAIPAHRQVIEYKGKRVSIRQVEREFRKNYVPGKIARVSLFVFNREWGVDGDVDGNGAVIINHSCDPNLHVRRLRGHILYFSKRKIRSGEELLIDYRLPAKSAPHPCRCGAKKCRGVMNELAPEKKIAKRKK